MVYEKMLIRSYRPGEELTLRKVFYSSVHNLAYKYYSSEQLNAWASNTYDVQEWNKRISTLKPFVAEINGDIVGYADLQPSGYIDHFFIIASHARQGIGSALMLHLHQIAKRKCIQQLSSDVSFSAESFFAFHGFKIEKCNLAIVKGIELKNIRMIKVLN